MTNLELSLTDQRVPVYKKNHHDADVREVQCAFPKMDADRISTIVEYLNEEQTRRKPIENV